MNVRVRVARLHATGFDLIVKMCRMQRSSSVRYTEHLVTWCGCSVAGASAVPTELRGRKDPVLVTWQCTSLPSLCSCPFLFSGVVLKDRSHSTLFEGSGVCTENVVLRMRSAAADPCR